MDYFTRMINYCNETIEFKDSYGRGLAHFDLAGIYAFLGDKESAYKHLIELRER